MNEIKIEIEHMELSQNIMRISVTLGQTRTIIST